ncbi:MAG: WXG100 family type VII secretion target [Ardenticatenaceae bacterium]
MSQAVANPEDMERFARELKQFNSQLASSMKRLNGQFSRLGGTWRDQEHQKFAQQYQQTMRVLNQFQRSSDQQIPFLLRKAQRLRDYLNQR